MSTWTIPRRISFGFITLVLLSLLLGGLGLWRVLAVNKNVVNLATNSVPSVVTLNKIIQFNNDSAKYVRKIVDQAADEKIVADSVESFKTARNGAEELMEGYKKLFSDDKDKELFLAAQASRKTLLAASDKVIDLVRSKQVEEAINVQRAEIEPILDLTVKGFNEDIYYNLFDWLVLCVVYVLDVFLFPLPVSYLLQL